MRWRKRISIGSGRGYTTWGSRKTLWGNRPGAREQGGRGCPRYEGDHILCIMDWSRMRLHGIKRLNASGTLSNLAVIQSRGMGELRVLPSCLSMPAVQEIIGFSTF